MSLRIEKIGPVPAETERVARAAFPKGNAYMQMRDVLGVVYTDVDFAPLFATRGRPAEAPWRLALVTVLQFAEGLSDRQAADAVRARIDWKYALGLELSDSGFDFSILCDFRKRLVQGTTEHRLLDALLRGCKERGYLKARGRQRTDSTHVLGALRVINRLERLAETLRAALNALAGSAPTWLRAHVSAAWFERYDRRIADDRLPRGKEARRAYAQIVGTDGMDLFTALLSPDTPSSLRELPAVETLRRVWLQQYVVIDEQIRLREAPEMPPIAEQIESPYEREARFASKGDHSWVGYKVHLTETCDEEFPFLLTQVETTRAPAPDVEQLSAIQADLANKDLLPRQHLVDSGYVRARNLVASRTVHQIDLMGPTYANRQWQAKIPGAFAQAHFRVDWDAHRVTCPQGHASVRWYQTQTARGSMIHVDFAPRDCTPCPVRARCTRAQSLPRRLTLQPRAEHEAIQAARQRQTTDAFAREYARRAAIEGTVSQGVRAFGLRRARYQGLAKTHLQHVATAAAMNIGRLINWLNEVPRATTRCSPFAALAQAS